jgi:Xaa-Pro dipeptidase
MVSVLSNIRAIGITPSAQTRGAIKAIGDELKPGMVFAFNIDFFDPKWKNGETGSVFAETVLITDTGAERMHSYPFDFQVLPA